MRWQMAAANKTAGASDSANGLHFEITEGELLATGVSTNFYDPYPAKTCRESAMLTYGLGGLVFSFFCLMMYLMGLWDSKDRGGYEVSVACVKVRVQLSLSTESFAQLRN